MSNLTLEQEAVNYETSKHIRFVQRNLHIIIKHLLDRSDHHDDSKLEDPEVQAFTENTAKLSGMTFGSSEYYESLKLMKPTLDHHYANNRHHPQHFKNGIDDMNLVDLLEMFCDWYASSKRHNDGNINKSIEINAGRFGISPQLRKILENSVKFFEE